VSAPKFIYRNFVTNGMTSRRWGLRAVIKELYSRELPLLLPPTQQDGTILGPDTESAGTFLRLPSLQNSKK
jgi:hypothetical protein